MAPTDQPSTVSDLKNSGNSEDFVSENEEMVTKGSDSKPESEMEKVTDSLMKVTLNPLAKEFFPSSYGGDQTANNGNDGYRRMEIRNYLGNLTIEVCRINSIFCSMLRRNSYTRARRRLNGRTHRAQREDSIRRTVYVSEIDHTVSEEELASVFIGRCGHVVDCRICGDPHSQLRFAFVEFTDEQGAKEALELCGTMMGLYAIKVLPSKTAILPVNPMFLPKSNNELAMVARTVYCTNIDRLISPIDVKLFFETFCGEVTRLRLLGDYVHSTLIAFVEFAMAESAITALSCSGMLLGNYPIRVSPSKTPVRGRTRPAQE